MKASQKILLGIGLFLFFRPKEFTEITDLYNPFLPTTFDIDSKNLTYQATNSSSYKCFEMDFVETDWTNSGTEYLEATLKIPKTLHGIEKPFLKIYDFQNKEIEVVEINSNGDLELIIQRENKFSGHLIIK
jgi:hypothetical protein